MSKRNISVKADTKMKSISDATLEERAKAAGVRYKKSVNQRDIRRDVLAIIPEETARRFRIAAIGRNKKKNTVELIMVDPHDIQALNVLRFLAKKTGERFEIFLVEEPVFDAVLSLYETTERALKEVVDTMKDEANAQQGEEEDGGQVSSGVLKDAPVAKLVEVIIRHAVDGKASDIHIEPTENEYRVRYRVDGILRHSLTLPKGVGKAVVARVKILALLKIDERRKPQDGRFHVQKSGGKRIDFRVSTFPVIEGEKVVMRVLDKDQGTSDLKSLGLLGKSYEVFDERIRDPYGIILLTGPTGSGKSTTLYGFLRILNTENTNIVTLEDPVEYFIEGINQSQVRPDIGYTFANGLRSILRQDPNIIMVGEIRDAETAELAIHSALTGHLVFSTLHTNNALGAIPRLIDMGVEPFLLSASVRAVGAQRLVRRICENCKRKARINKSYLNDIAREFESVQDEEIEKYGIDAGLVRRQPLTFYEGAGCEECGNLGYKGRVAIYEIFEVDRDVQDLLGENKNISENALQSMARNQHMITLKQDGILKAVMGLTTLAEVDRVTESDVAVGGDMTDDAG